MKKSWRFKRRHWRDSIGLDSLFQKTPKRSIKPGDAFENTAFERWFENVKGRREAALNLSVKQMLPIDSRHQVDSGRCNFHLLIARLTLVSLLERYVDWKCHAAWRHRKSAICISIVYGETWGSHKERNAEGLKPWTDVVKVLVFLQSLQQCSSNGP
jgi:hypothetical protein